MPVIKKRLQIQPTGRRGIDRSINFVVGELSEGERKRLRGPVFHATSRVDALRLHRELLELGRKAADENDVGGFLDAVDRRSRPGADWGPTFAAFVEEWVKTCVESGGLRESQVESDRSIVNKHLLPAFGTLPLGEIDTRRIDRYIASKRQQKHQYGAGYAPKSINNHIGVLHRIFEKAIEYGHIEKNPVTKRTWLRRGQTAEDGRAWWTADEEAKVFVTLEQWREAEPRVAVPILTQLVTGIRFSELRALQKEDLDLRVPGLWIRRAQARQKVSTPKNKRARFHVIPRALAEVLRVWMLKTEGQLLFPAESGRALPNNTLNRAYSRLAAEAGVRRITSHGARHTSGSSYAVMGAGQKMIATLLGHTDTGATERYTHIQVDATRALVEARWARLNEGSGSE